MASEQSEPRLRVAICGGGVGGLTLAYQLSKSADVRVDVYEAASRFAELGAGIVIPKRPRRVFAEMGLEGELLALAGNPPLDRAHDLQYWRADSEVLEHVYSKTAKAGGVVSVHRAEFHNLLLRNLPAGTRTRSSKRLVRYTEPESSNEPIKLIFTDGSEETCDVLVGADGIKSAVRGQMLEELAAAVEKGGDQAAASSLRDAVPPRYSGLTSYRTVFPREKLERVAPDHPVLSGAHKMYLGKSKMFITFPISKGKLITVSVSIMDFSIEDTLHPEPWAAQGDAGQISSFFEGWAPEAQHIISCMNGCDIKRWVVNAVRPLPTFAKGRVALLGDAAHAMPPYLGAGAGSAVEDAYALSAILAHTSVTRSTAAEALRTYSTIRQPVTIAIAANSAQLGRIYGAQADFSREDFGSKVQELFDSFEQGDPTAPVKRALEALDAGLGA